MGLDRHLFTLAHGMGVHRAAAWVNRRRMAIPVVMYHRVSRATAGEGLPSCLEMIGMVVTEAQFEAQVSYLCSQYAVVSLRDYLAWRDGRGTIPARAAVITFDDGYRDNAEVACRVLEKHGSTATFFVIGNAVAGEGEIRPYALYRLIDALDGRTVPVEVAAGRRLLFDLSTRPRKRSAVAAVRRLLREADESVVRRLEEQLRRRLREEGLAVPSGYDEFMSREDLRGLHARGFTIGAHSQTHRRLAGLSEAEQVRELVGVRRLLHEITGATSIPFAYPYGQPADVGPNTPRLVAQAGYSCALTTVEGLNDASTDLFRLRRIEMGPVSRPEYSVRVAGVVGSGKSALKRALGRN